jgi:hypothetical protein
MTHRPIREILTELHQAIEAEIIGRMTSGGRAEKPLEALLGEPERQPYARKAAKRKSPARAATPTATTRPRKKMRSPVEVDKIAGRLLGFFVKHPGSTLAEARDALKLSAMDVQFPIRKLKNSGQITGRSVSGNKQDMRYSPART